MVLGHYSSYPQHPWEAGPRFYGGEKPKPREGLGLAQGHTAAKRHLPQSLLLTDDFNPCFAGVGRGEQVLISGSRIFQNGLQAGLLLASVSLSGEGDSPLFRLQGWL